MLFPVYLDFGADKGGDSRCIFLGADNEQLVAQMEDGVLVGDADMAIVADA